MAGNAFKIDRISRLEEDWNGRYAAERTLFSRLCGLIHVRICNMQRHFPSCSASLCDCPKAWILDISKRQLSPVIRHSQVGTIINSLLSNFDSLAALLSFFKASFLVLVVVILFQKQAREFDTADFSTSCLFKWSVLNSLRHIEEKWSIVAVKWQL